MDRHQLSDIIQRRARDITPSAAGKPWTKTILHDFAGGPGDGADPTGHVTLDASGAIFGTTLSGGAANYGTVYRISQ